MATIDPVRLQHPAIATYHSAVPAFTDGGDSPRAFLERCLARIDAREAEVRAFAALNVEGARAAADAATARWRAGRPLSPVDGMPIGVKDIFWSADMPTGMGSPIFKGWQSRWDGAAVGALRSAGAVILGKTVTTEFATRPPGPTRNPHDLARTPGGSSSGSAAAVAAGMVAVALGSQVVGSVLRPGSYCGVIGFKPSVGALNRAGSHDILSHSCLGLHANGLDDMWQAALAIVERVGGDPGYPGLDAHPRPGPAQRPAKLALLRTAGWESTHPEAQGALLARLDAWREQGIAILDAEGSRLVAEVEAAIRDALDVAWRIVDWEFRWPLEAYAVDHLDLLSDDAQSRLASARKLGLGGYRQALAERETMRATFARLAGEVDAVVTLAATGAAPLGEATGDPVFNVPASVLGVPAFSLPLLRCEELPLGLQLIGFAGRDQALSGTAAWALAEV